MKIKSTNKYYPQPQLPLKLLLKVDRTQYCAIKLASGMEKQTDLTLKGKGTQETLALHQRKQIWAELSLLNTAG